MGTNLMMAAECTTTLYVELLAEGARPTSTKLRQPTGTLPTPGDDHQEHDSGTSWHQETHYSLRSSLPQQRPHDWILGRHHPRIWGSPIVKLDTKISMMHSHGFTQNWPPCRARKKNKCSQCPKIWPWSTPQKSSQSPCFLSLSSSTGEKPEQQLTPYTAGFQQKFLLNTAPELSQNT